LHIPTCLKFYPLLAILPKKLHEDKFYISPISAQQGKYVIAKTGANSGPRVTDKDAEAIFSTMSIFFMPTNQQWFSYYCSCSQVSMTLPTLTSINSAGYFSFIARLYCVQ